MRRHPILFSTEMVKAILEGRKTQTRRIIKSRHESGMFAVSTAKYEPDAVGYYHNRCVDSLDWDEGTVDGGGILCPYGEVGDILWVREGWRYAGGYESKPDYSVMDISQFVYKADEEWNGPFKPSIHMPKNACRIFLEITDIKVERLQDISESDCCKEGCGLPVLRDYKKPKFAALWKSINGDESWDKNPWVWVIEFKVISTTGLPAVQECDANPLNT